MDIERRKSSKGEHQTAIEADIPVEEVSAEEAKRRRDLLRVAVGEMEKFKGGND